jgi:hypothetical protein
MLFFYIAMGVEQVLLKEKPAKLLEISMSGSRYGRLASDCQARARTVKPRIDRIDLSEELKGPSKPYDNILPLETLDHPETLEVYDIILTADLLERLDGDTARQLVERLCEKVAKLLLVIAPHGAPSEEIFKSAGVDFHCHTLDAVPEKARVISVFPKRAQNSKNKGGGVK